MGTIAARDCLRVLQLTEQVVAALLIAVRQGVWLRCRDHAEVELSASLIQMLESLATDIEPVTEDRRLDPELRVLVDRIRDQAWELYA